MAIKNPRMTVFTVTLGSKFEKKRWVWGLMDLPDSDRGKMGRIRSLVGLPTHFCLWEKTEITHYRGSRFISFFPWLHKPDQNIRGRRNSSTASFFSFFSMSGQPWLCSGRTDHRKGNQTHKVISLFQRTKKPLVCMTVFPRFCLIGFWKLRVRRPKHPCIYYNSWSVQPLIRQVTPRISKKKKLTEVWWVVTPPSLDLLPQRVDQTPTWELRFLLFGDWLRSVGRFRHHWFDCSVELTKLRPEIYCSLTC